MIGCSCSGFIPEKEKVVEYLCVPCQLSKERKLSEPSNSTRAREERLDESYSG